MTPSSTPGSPSHDDPMPWSDDDRHGADDATRPMPPVSRFPEGPPPADTAAGPRERRDPSAPGPERTLDDSADWSWYDDDDQHTRPMPSVTAQRPVHDEPASYAPGGGHGAAPGSAPAAGYPTAGYPTAPGHGTAPAYGTAGHRETDPAARLARRREEFGGLQLVPGFYGWLSALALTWLLLALAGLVASAMGAGLPEAIGDIVDDLASGTAAAWSAVAVLGVVEFLAFLGGGYTAGRMARFSGAGQGVSVWLWSLFGRSVATVAGLVWADTVGLSPVGISAQALIGEQLAPGLLAVAAVLAVDLLGAVLGGLWGLRYHRRVDRWDDTER
ncbi:hypothetical protein ACH9EU_08985 [Kocuria sp. M1R5S2]|uniref:hypothetical protein n=1 Tax=Kocuria rhizosphaerae TaxID=3376285 RepID=UPI0037BC0C12